MANRRSQAPGNSPGYVYLIKRGPYYKIGHTYDVAARLKGMRNDRAPQESYPFPPILIWSLYCIDHITTERALQQHCAGCYIGIGEWYDLPSEMVSWICEQSEELICLNYRPATYRRPMF